MIKLIHLDIAIYYHSDKIQDMIWMSEKDVERLADYKRGSDQVKWLAENGYRFIQSRNGSPLVFVNQFQNSSSDKTEPDLAALEALG